MSTLSQFSGGGIKGSVQRGTITISIGSGSTTATVNSVDVNKSLLTHLGQSGYYNASTTDGLGNVRLFLTNGTTITASAYASPNIVPYVVSYELVEYY
jgi:hypothetical protein